MPVNCVDNFWCSECPRVVVNSIFKLLIHYQQA